MKKLQVAIIGTGGRSNSYAMAYSSDDSIEIAALADPVPEHRKTTAEVSAIKPGYREYDSWEKLLASEKNLDGVVIATPNHLHAEPAIACLKRGIPVACEKPLATTKADCERIIDTEKEYNGRTLIGFVLRSTPFYKKINELSNSGRIGNLISIQADELPGVGVTSIMNRSPWRRYESFSGGAMLEKSCHDMDILNWMTGSRPRSLHSFGSRRIFTPTPALPDFCDKCPSAKACRYYKEPVFSKHEDKMEKLMHNYIREDNRCIYNIDKDGLDVQSVQLEYQNGAIVNFMLQFNCSGPRASRNFHAIGTRGSVYGNLQENNVFLYDFASEKEEKHELKNDGSDHGGGGKLHALELKKMMQDPDYMPSQNAGTGYLSAVMCFAADRSVREGRRIHFDYDKAGRINII